MLELVIGGHIGKTLSAEKAAQHSVHPTACGGGADKRYPCKGVYLQKIRPVNPPPGNAHR